MRIALVAALLLLAAPTGVAAAPELVKLGEFSEPSRSRPRRATGRD